MCAWRQDTLLVDDAEAGPILVDATPLCFGHLLVVSSIHVASVADMEEDERRAFLGRVELACELAGRIGGRPAVAIEHGRHPTCGDRSGACHAHVHVAPVGPVDEEAVAELGLPRAERWAETHPYLAFGRPGSAPRIHELARAVPHAARTVAGTLADANGVRWRPLASPDRGLAGSTLESARRALRSRGASRVHPTVPRRIGRRAKPALAVYGSTGAGKTTVAVHLARSLGVPAVELGVVLRMLCLDLGGSRDTRPADRIWRWARTGRLDFDAVSPRALAAALPRLDGATDEVSLWRGVEISRMAELARDPQVEETLWAVARMVCGRDGGVVVGRGAPRLEGLPGVHLSAQAATRARRKSAQLQAVDVGSDAHDWFDPFGQGGEGAASIDTTSMSVAEMQDRALGCVAELGCGGLETQPGRSVLAGR